MDILGKNVLGRGMSKAGVLVHLADSEEEASIARIQTVEAKREVTRSEGLELAGPLGPSRCFEWCGMLPGIEQRT
jgi:hypothetical protein